jgi:glycosyltransferase involved in cell wall biosynthesis
LNSGLRNAEWAKERNADMRLLLAIDGMHPRDGGPPMVVAGSALELQAQRVGVTILTTLREGDREEILATWSTLTDAGVKIAFCAPIGSLDILPWSGNHSTIEAAVAEADVVHLHGLWNPVLVHTARIAHKLGKPYFFSTHGVLDFRAMRSTAFKFLKKRAAVVLLNLRSLLRDASGVIFGSEAEASQSWTIAQGINKVFVPNGVTVANAALPVSDEERQLLLSVAPEYEHWDRSLLFFARIHPEKGTDLLVQAFNIVAPEFPRVGLLIAGLKQDVVFQAKVEVLIAQTPDPSRLIFTTALTGQKSQFLYRMFDCYILPSHAEGFSVALAEALANGRPALITRYCHMPVVEQYSAGIIVDTTVDDLVKGLRKLLGMSEAELQEMGQNARNLYTENFTWPKVTAGLVTVYSDAIARQKERSR